MKPCTRLNLVCREKEVPYGAVVKRGMKIGSCEVVFASPEECFVVPRTRVEFVSKKRIEFKELEKNIAIIEYLGDKRFAYVYPKKIIEKIMDKYIEPMAHGKPPRTSGLLLVGAPGTGKTTLAQLLAEYVGVSVFEIEPDVQAKYVGETEHNLKKIIEDAISSEPSIVIIDDCEWLLSARKLADEESNKVAETMRRIMLKYLQEITNKKIRVLFIATTNKKADFIDIAFRRPGRFDDPILVPLPDLEAIKFLLEFYGVSKDKIDYYAMKLLNAGASASHVVRVANDIVRGKEPDINVQNYRGYKRYHVDPIKDFEKLFNYMPKEVLNRASRIQIHGLLDVATAIALQLVSLANKSAVIISNPKYIEEAVHTANMYGSIIIMPSDTEEIVQYFVHVNAEVPIIFVGRKPAIMAYPIFNVERVSRIVGVEAVVKAIADYKKIDIDEETLKKTVKYIRNHASVETALNIFSTLGVVNDKILNML